MVVLKVKNLSVILHAKHKIISTMTIMAAVIIAIVEMILCFACKNMLKFLNRLVISTNLVWFFVIHQKVRSMTNG